MLAPWHRPVDYHCHRLIHSQDSKRRATTHDKFNTGAALLRLATAILKLEFLGSLIAGREVSVEGRTAVTQRSATLTLVRA